MQAQKVYCRKLIFKFLKFYALQPVNARKILKKCWLIDISMPGMGGIEASRIIRIGVPEICVIGLSMHNQEEMRRAMHEAGAKAYVCKSEPTENLMATIRSVQINLKSYASSSKGRLKTTKSRSG